MSISVHHESTVRFVPESVLGLTEVAAKAWSVDLVIPEPPAMPSDRLSARAELVKTATSCGGY